MMEGKVKIQGTKTVGYKCRPGRLASTLYFAERHNFSA